MAPRALVAPDSFKGTFDAPTVAGALADGLREAGWEADVCPVADGGEGTLALLVQALGGELVEVAAHDPLGRPVDCQFALVERRRDGDRRDGAGVGPRARRRGRARRVAASTRGTGELILAAAAAGAREILVAVGGSATTDGGAGAIDGDPRRRRARRRAAGGAVRRRDARSRTRRGSSARRRAPTRRSVARLEERLAALARDAAARPARRPRDGRAGGLSGGLWAAFDAELRAGAAAVLDALGVDARMRAAQLVVAGEGCLDEQSFGGKIVGELVRRAGAAGVPVARGRRDEPAVGRRGGARRAAGVWIATTLGEIAAAGRALGAACVPR